MRYSRQLRQEIIKDFAERNGGRYEPAAFVEEVRATGRTHPAYEWFEWDEEKAAKRYQVEQAREFASGLRVVFKIETVGRRDKISVKTTDMPFMCSPLDRRSKGGGYYCVDPKDPAHIAEHCRQAADTLAAWARRYEAALAAAGVAPGTVPKIISQLEVIGGGEAEAAEAA